MAQTCGSVVIIHLVSVLAGESMTLAIFGEPHALSAGKPVALDLK